MDVIKEDCEQQNSDFFNVPATTVTMNGLVGSSNNNNNLEDSVHSESTSEISDSETDFAKKLRKQRKQVLEEGGVKQSKNQDFSQVLRQHREELVGSWEVQQTQHNTQTGLDTPNLHDEHQQSSPPVELTGSELESSQLAVDMSQISYSATLENEDTDLDAFFAPPATPSSQQSPDDFFGALQDTSGVELDDVHIKEAVGPGTPSRVLDDLLAVTPTPTMQDANSDELMATDGANGPADSPTFPTESFDFGITVSQEDPTEAAVPSQEGHQVMLPDENIPSLPEPHAEDAQPIPYTESSNEPIPSDVMGETVPPTATEAISLSASDSKDDDSPPTDLMASIGHEPANTKSIDDPNDLTEPTLSTRDDGTLLVDTQPQPDIFASDSLEPTPSDAENMPQSSGTSAIDTPDATTLATLPAGENGIIVTLNADPATAQETSDDDFGDFDSFPAKQAPDVPQEDDGDFGDFDGAPSTDSPVLIDSADIIDGDLVKSTETNTQKEESDFGDFGAAPPLTVGDDVAPVDNNNIEAIPAQSLPDEDNDFGDFDAAPTDTSPELNNVDLGKNEQEEKTDFGVFGAAPQLIEGDDVTLPTNDKDLGTFPAQSLDEDDDFGDFDAAPTSASPEMNNDLGNNKQEEESDFGDFGAAALTDGDGVAPPLVDKDFGTVHAQSLDEGDDFGDFDAAPPTSTPPEMNNDLGNNTQEEESDFGDFGAAVATQVVDKDLDTVPVQSIDEDNDFGDFDAAPASTSLEINDLGKNDTGKPEESQPTASSWDDDDFGDFDAAPPSATPEGTSEFGDFDTIKPPQEQQKSSGESELQPSMGTDDNDFGDFEDVQPPNVDTDNDTFGDFGVAAQPVSHENEKKDVKSSIGASSSEMPSGGVTFHDFNAGAPSELGSSDLKIQIPLELQETKSHLARLQSKYPFNEIKQNEGDSIVSMKTTLTEFLDKGVASDTLQESRVDRLRELIQLLETEREVESVSSPEVILEGDAQGPFAQFSLPMSVLSNSDGEKGRQLLQQKGGPGTKSSSRAPPVISIQLPTTTVDVPLSTASPKTSRRSPSSNVTAPNHGMMDVPTLSTANDSAQISKSSSTGGSTPAVQALLSKIPNLSFMLQPNLVLAKK